LGYHNR